MDFSGRGSIGNKLNRPEDETSFTISPTYILTNSHDCLLRVNDIPLSFLQPQLLYISMKTVSLRMLYVIP